MTFGLLPSGGGGCGACGDGINCDWPMVVAENEPKPSAGCMAAGAGGGRGGRIVPPALPEAAEALGAGHEFQSMSKSISDSPPLVVSILDAWSPPPPLNGTLWLLLPSGLGCWCSMEDMPPGINGGIEDDMGGIAGPTTAWARSLSRDTDDEDVAGGRWCSRWRGLWTLATSLLWRKRWSTGS